MDDNSKSSVDDDELNQMIANISSQSAPPVAPTPPAPAQPSVQNPVPVNDPSASVPQPVEAPSPIPAEAVATPIPAPLPEPSVQQSPTPPTPAPVSNLDTIKQDAIAELRPLVDKLNLSPEDRFNTILLIIRSTDDVSLLPAVHAAAKQIPDDGRRAQALLDVIKEIDFFKQ